MPNEWAVTLCSCSPIISAVFAVEAYRMSLETDLQQNFIPLTHHELNVDLMAEKMVASLLSAASDTMPQTCSKPRVHSRKQQPWFDSSCKQALKRKETVYKNPHSTAEQKQAAEKIFRSLTDRVKETWTRQRNVELCEMATKGDFWRVFKTPLSNSCPVELSEQLEAFRSLMGAEGQRVS